MRRKYKTGLPDTNLFVLSQDKLNCRCCTVTNYFFILSYHIYIYIYIYIYVHGRKKDSRKSSTYSSDLHVLSSAIFCTTNGDSSLRMLCLSPFDTIQTSRKSFGTLQPNFSSSGNVACGQTAGWTLLFEVFSVFNVTRDAWQSFPQVNVLIYLVSLIFLFKILILFRSN